MPVAYSTGAAVKTAARPRSALIMMRRRSERRSAHAPATSENSRYGMRPAAVR